MSDQGEGVLKNLGIFSTLQAATKAKFFLLAASFILLVDNVLLQLKQPGIFDLVAKKEVLEGSNLPLKAILIFVAFSFLTSMILPILAIVFDEVLRITVGNGQIALDSYMNKLFKVEDKSLNREHDCVLLHELRRKAHESKESYYINLYDKHRKLQEESRASMFEFAMYSFYCLAMLTFNFYIGQSNKKATSMILADYFESSAVIWYSIAALIVMVGYRFFTSYRPEWIYCPSLYDEITEKNKSLRSLCRPTHHMN